MNESYRLRYTNQIVGVFLLVLFLSIAILGVAVTRVSRVLVTPTYFNLVLSEEVAADLQSGAEIIVLGKRIGYVESLNYVDDSDKIQAKLAIDPESSKQITTESELSIERKFGLGSPIIKVRRKPVEGSTTAATPLPSGSTITRFRGEVDRVEQTTNKVQEVGSSIIRMEENLNPTLRSIDIAANTLTKSLEQSFDPALDNSKTAFQSVERTSEALRPDTLQTLEIIRNTTIKLEKDLSELTRGINAVVEGEIRETLRSIENSAVAAKGAAQSVERTSTSIDHKSDATQAQLNETLRTLREAIASFQKLTTETREVVRIVRGEANVLPGTTERVNDTVGDTQELVRDIQNHWLLRRSQRDDPTSQQVSPSSQRAGVGR